MCREVGAYKIGPRTKSYSICPDYVQLTTVFLYFNQNLAFNAQSRKVLHCHVMIFGFRGWGNW